MPDGGLLVEQRTDGDRTHYVLLDKMTVDRLASGLPLLLEHAHSLGRMQTWELEEVS